MSDDKFTLLMVDDEENIVDSLKRAFRRDYNVITSTGGAAAIDALKQTQVDLIICDQRMPDVTGDRVLTFAKETQPDAVRILLTGYSDIEALVKCVNDAAIYKYLTKPWEPEMLRLTVVRALETLDLQRKLRATTSELQKAYVDSVTMLSVACEGKDEDTGFHVRRVQHYTKALAIELGLGEAEAEDMGVMSILHDVGKIFVPDAVLKKPAKLDEAEWVIMKQHPAFGVRILGENPHFDIARQIAGGHHENFDGSGYPGGLKGEAIPIAARITKVADVFDALTSRRPYKKPWSVDAALETMQAQSGVLYDPRVVNGLVKLNSAGIISSIMTRYHALEHVEGDSLSVPD